MPNGIKWPTLPSGWRYGDEADLAGLPESSPSSPDVIQKNVGSMFREVMGPRKPIEGPSIVDELLKPIGKQVADTFVPQDPLGIGLFLASTLLPGGPLVKPIMGKVGSKIVPIAKNIGTSGFRRVLGMGGIGAAVSGLMGQDPLEGAREGLTTQLGGEGITKLTQFASANTQAKALAQSDPETLGKVVSQIIPGLGKLRSPKDFHLAFKKSAAQTAISDSFRTGLSEVSAAIGQTPIPSVMMKELRGNPALVASPISMSPGVRGMPAAQALGYGGKPAMYSFDDVAETIQRLRTVGWNADEAARGLKGKDHRQFAEDLETELMQSLPPDVAAKYKAVNEMYARGKRLISFLNDPKLLKPDGMLNIPKLQERIKSKGYSVGQSYQMAADAADLENALFRGSGSLAEDTPGAPGNLGIMGRLLGLRHSSGILPKLKELPIFTGVDPAGLSPFGGSQVMQLLKRSVGQRPNTLRAEEEE
jgi:hypothetical protein